MKVVITGICGFVGSTVAIAWLQADPTVEIIGLDSLARPGSETNRLRLQKCGIRFIHGDIRMASDLEQLPKVDWVVDASANPSVLAGVDGCASSRQLMEHNLLGTLNVLEFCKRHNAGFILLSTSRVYSVIELLKVPMEVSGASFRPLHGHAFPAGLSAGGVSEEFCTNPPVSLYGSSKLASELLAVEYGTTFGFPVQINRCGTLAGAGQFGRADQGIFSYWINTWLRRRSLAYIGFGGSGHQVRDCLHPRDLVSLLMKQTAGDENVSERIINLGGGVENSISLAGLSEWCEQRFGSHPVDRVADGRRFDVPWLVMDSSLAHKVWGWRPETGIREILEEIALHAEQNPDWLELSEQG